MATDRGALIEALETSAGIFSVAGQKLGITGQRVGQLVKGDAELEAIVKRQVLKVNDLAKSVIIEAIKKGDARQANWWLERRDDEFKPKHQLTGKDDAPLFNPDTAFNGLTDDEISAVLAIRRRASAGSETGT